MKLSENTDFEETFKGQFVDGKTTKKILAKNKIVSPPMSRVLRLDARTIISVPENISDDNLDEWIKNKKKITWY